MRDKIDISKVWLQNLSVWFSTDKINFYIYRWLTNGSINVR